MRDETIEEMVVRLEKLGYQFSVDWDAIPLEIEFLAEIGVDKKVCVEALVHANKICIIKLIVLYKMQISDPHPNFMSTEQIVCEITELLD